MMADANAIAQIKREALARQGGIIVSNGKSYLVAGDKDGKVEFLGGAEGIVHLVTEENTGTRFRVKCFFDSDKARLERCKNLVARQLANRKKKVADALAGAPFEMTERLGPLTPFGIMMKDVPGTSWKNLKEGASNPTTYPPRGWPSLSVRATWAYGLATAIMYMEKASFIHADISDGNVMVVPNGEYPGDMALVDFDSFLHPTLSTQDTLCRGTPGYAAPEVWTTSRAEIGTDRFGMAILIQEFLLRGDPDLNEANIVALAYDQETELCKYNDDAHPLLWKRYPPIAKLLCETLRATSPAQRPSPDEWRTHLRQIVEGSESLCVSFKDLVIKPYPPNSRFASLTFGSGEKELDLSNTAFRCGILLRRQSDTSIEVHVTKSAEARVKSAKDFRWRIIPNGASFPVDLDTIVMTPGGASSVTFAHG